MQCKTYQTNFKRTNELQNEIHQTSITMINVYIYIYIINVSYNDVTGSASVKASLSSLLQGGHCPPSHQSPRIRLFAVYCKNWEMRNPLTQRWNDKMRNSRCAEQKRSCGRCDKAYLMYLIRPAQGTQFEVTCEKPQLVPCWHLTYSPVLDGVDLEVRNLAYRPGWNLCLCCRLSQLLRVATFCYVVIVLKGPYQLGHTPGSALNILDQRN